MAVWARCSLTHMRYYRGCPDVSAFIAAEQVCTASAAKEICVFTLDPRCFGEEGSDEACGDLTRHHDRHELLQRLIWREIIGGWALTGRTTLRHTNQTPYECELYPLTAS